MKPLIALLFFLSAIATLQAGIVQGIINDHQGNPIPYAAVYLKNSTFGVSADEKGRYYIQLSAGNHELLFTAMGFGSTVKNVSCGADDKITLNVSLADDTREMKEVTISAKQTNRGREIMEKVREKRPEYFDNIQNYTCQTYQKISVEKENPVKTVAKDSSGKDTSLVRNILERKKSNLIESISTVYFQRPDKFKEVISAYHDFAVKKPVSASHSIGFSIDIGPQSISNETYEGKSDFLVDYDPQASDFNFYSNLINVPEISNKPLQSPLAATAELSYHYKLVRAFYENGKLIYQIHAEPAFKNEGLFEGDLYIEEGTWALKSVDLKINSYALSTCNEFHIIQDYDSFGTGIYLPVRREYLYTIRFGKETVYGTTEVKHSDYEVNTDLNPHLFSAEVKTYQPDAFSKDTTYWDKKRPVQLQAKEEDYILETDSLDAIYDSKEFLDSLDRKYNHLDIWSFLLTGIVHRDRYKKYSYYIWPLIQQINPVGIGGYRHQIGGSLLNEFPNHYTLETDGFLNYGFTNHDLKGKLGAGLTYYPKKFVRTYIDIGDYYELINSYASFVQLFSRSNYVRTKTIGIAQSMEIVNGLYGKLGFNYSDQIPINGLKLAEWSKELFGDLNTPTDFSRYLKSELRLDLKYVVGQKYVIRNDKKLIIGKYYPEFSLSYRKGIPGLFRSEVNYDYLEAGFHQEIKLARLGYSGLDISSGSFLNRKSLRVLEYKYFRGSDPWYFSNPLQSFQLLGPVISTSSAFLRANYVHHFEGWPTDKIPVIRALKISLAAGAGVLSIPSQHFNHAEIFGGIERVWRIRQQLFRFGVYAVTADNRIDGARYTIKFGVNFYDKFSGRWN